MSSVNPANGRTYHLLTPNTWTASEAEATTLGGHLTTINTVAENAWVFGTFSTSSRGLHIGYRRVSNGGIFSWVSGEPTTFTNWAPNEPNYPDELFAYILPNVAGYPAQWNNDYDRSTSTYSGLSGNIPLFSLNGVVEVEIVPEPSSGMVLSGVVLAGLSLSRRRFCPIGK